METATNKAAGKPETPAKPTRARAAAQPSTLLPPTMAGWPSLELIEGIVRTAWDHNTNVVASPYGVLANPQQESEDEDADGPMPAITVNERAICHLAELVAEPFNREMVLNDCHDKDGKPLRVNAERLIELVRVAFLQGDIKIEPAPAEQPATEQQEPEKPAAE